MKIEVLQLVQVAAGFQSRADIEFFLKLLEKWKYWLHAVQIEPNWRACHLSDLYTLSRYSMQVR